MLIYATQTELTCGCPGFSCIMIIDLWNRLAIITWLATIIEHLTNKPRGACLLAQGPYQLATISNDCSVVGPTLKNNSHYSRPTVMIVRIHGLLLV